MGFDGAATILVCHRKQRVKFPTVLSRIEEPKADAVGPNWRRRLLA
jgi:hypothetical protein